MIHILFPDCAVLYLPLHVPICCSPNPVRTIVLCLFVVVQNFTVFSFPLFHSYYNWHYGLIQSRDLFGVQFNFHFCEPQQNSYVGFCHVRDFGQHLWTFFHYPDYFGLLSTSTLFSPNAYTTQTIVPVINLLCFFSSLNMYAHSILFSITYFSLERRCSGHVVLDDKFQLLSSRSVLKLPLEFLHPYWSTVVKWIKHLPPSKKGQKFKSQTRHCPPARCCIWPIGILCGPVPLQVSISRLVVPFLPWVLGHSLLSLLPPHSCEPECLPPHREQSHDEWEDPVSWPRPCSW